MSLTSGGCGSSPMFCRADSNSCMLAGGWGSGDMERNISEEGVRAPLPSPDGWRGGEGTMGKKGKGGEGRGGEGRRGRGGEGGRGREREGRRVEEGRHVEGRFMEEIWGGEEIRGGQESGGGENSGEREKWMGEGRERSLCFFTYNFSA